MEFGIITLIGAVVMGFLGYNPTLLGIELPKGDFWVTIGFAYLGGHIGLAIEYALNSTPAERAREDQEPGGFPVTPKHILEWSLWGATILYLFTIILLFTPYTHNVDEIKVAIMLSCGPALWMMLLANICVIPPKGRIIPFFLPLFGFLAIFTISIFNSEHQWIGWHNFRFYTHTIVMAFIMALTINTKPRLIAACSLFTGLALLSCIFGIAHYYGYLQGFDKMFAGTTWENLLQTLIKRKEMFGTILNSDFFAAYLIMALPSSFALIFAAPQIWNRALGLVTAICMAGCIFLTESNETMIGVVAFLVIFFVGYAFLDKQSILRRRWAEILMLTGGVFFSVLPFAWENIQSRFAGLGGAFGARGIIYSGAWDMFLDAKWLGWGPGTFRMIFPQFRHQDYIINEISNVTLFAHNQFLGLLCETGIFAFAMYMLFLGIIGGFLVHEIRKRPNSDLKIFQFAFLGGLLAIHIQNFFSPNYRWVAPAIGYNTMIGLCIATANISMIPLLQSGQIKRSPLELGIAQARPVWLGVSCFLVALMGLYSFDYGYKYFQGAYHNNMGISLQNSVTQLESMLKREKDPQMKARISGAIVQNQSKAITEFEQAIDINPRFLTSYYKIAHTYNSQNNYYKSLQYYNDLSYYNPDYSEIYHNYGVILQRMFIENYHIDKAVLLRYAKEFNQRLNRDYDVTMAEISVTNEPMPDSTRFQVFSIIRDVTNNNPKLMERDDDGKPRSIVSLTELIPKSSKTKRDWLLLECSAWSFGYAAHKVAHKPMVWEFYLSSLYQTKRYREMQDMLLYAFSDDDKKSYFREEYFDREHTYFNTMDWDRSHKPMHRWGDAFDEKRDRFEQMLFQAFLENEDYDGYARFLDRKLAEEPNDPITMQRLFELTRKYLYTKPDVALNRLRTLTEQNPLEWRYHYLLGNLYNDLSASTTRQFRATQATDSERSKKEAIELERLSKEYSASALLLFLRVNRILEKYPDRPEYPRPNQLTMITSERVPDRVTLLNQIVALISNAMNDAETEAEHATFKAAGIHYANEQIEALGDDTPNRAQLENVMKSYINRFENAKFTRPEDAAAQPNIPNVTPRDRDQPTTPTPQVQDGATTP